MSTALEHALAAINGANADPIHAAKCRGLMHGYDARWKDAGWETLSVEEVFHLPVINPETGAASRTFTQAGKYDGIAEHSGRVCLIEHKTTSDDIADPASHYWKRLTIDSQVSAYVLANWQNGRKLDGTLYDVVKKPGIRPKAIPKADLKAIASFGTYFGTKVPPDVLNNIIVHGQTDECPALYGFRLASDCIENPNKYFQRRMVPRLDNEVSEYAQELWDVGKTILEARANNRHYRNSGACMQWGSPCEYLSICCGEDSVESDRWQKPENVHSELPILDKSGGRSVLTNSRIKTFQTCRRKHYFRHELGIRKYDEEEKEALVFGSLWHLALENWWSFFMKGTEDVHSDEAPAVNAAAGAEA